MWILPRQDRFSNGLKGSDCQMALQWGFEYRIHWDFRWVNEVPIINGLVLECHSKTELPTIRQGPKWLPSVVPFLMAWDHS